MAGTTAIKKFVNYFWGESDADMEPETEQAETITNEVYGYEEEPETMGGIEGINPFKRKSKIVSMPQPQQIKMKISKQTKFDQVDEIINQLKEKNAVVINLEYVSKDVARRIVDVVGGAIKALDGHIEKVSNSIFVVAPFNYDIINEATKEKIESKFSASWIK